MSTCISSKGEYRSHTPDNDYVCTFCGVLDEDALIAELNRLRAECDHPASTYRLPDWLGGHEVVIVDDHDNGDYTVKTVGDVDGARQRVRVGQDVLVEVRPPSIEDPVTLPLRLEDTYRDGIEISSRLVAETPFEIQRFNANGDVGSPVYLTADQARNMARALWQRANAVEHGPVSGPIGSRTEQARALDERNGVVAVRQPGGGAS